MKILIVDDEPSLRSLLYHILTRAGYEVAEAQDGEQALTLLAREPIDCLVADVMMPRMGGLELILEVRKSCPRMPTLVMSGIVDVTSDAFMRLCDVAGVRRILKKPFSVVEFESAVRQSIGHPNAAVPA